MNEKFVFAVLLLLGSASAIGATTLIPQSPSENAEEATAVCPVKILSHEKSASSTLATAQKLGACIKGDVPQTVYISCPGGTRSRVIGLECPAINEQVLVYLKPLDLNENIYFLSSTSKHRVRVKAGSESESHRQLNQIELVEKPRKSSRERDTTSRSQSFQVMSSDRGEFPRTLEDFKREIE